MSRVLVTGATGFIGARLCAALRARGDEVTALSRRSGEGLTLLDDWSLEGLKSVIGNSKFDTIFHLAAYGVAPGDRDAHAMFTVNTLLPVTMVALASHCGAAIVTTGSNAEYATPTSSAPVTENSPLRADTLYGASKAAGWLAASASALSENLPLTHLRLFNIYGPGEAPHRLLASLSDKLKRGVRVPLSDGAQIRDFVHVDDVVGACLMTAAKPQGVRALNVCTGRGHSVADFAREACVALGADESLLGFGDHPRRPDDIPALVGNADLTASALGWRAKHTLKTGLAATLSQKNKAA